MKLVKESINEFHKTGDIKSSLKMGEASIENITFDTEGELEDFIIDIIPYILGTNGIPEDIINEKNTYIRDTYFRKIRTFLEDRKISFKDYGDYYIDPFSLHKKLNKLGFKTFYDSQVNEFHKTGDIKSSLGIGEYYQKDIVFPSAEEAANHIISLLPLILERESIPEDILGYTGDGTIINTKYFLKISYFYYKRNLTYLDERDYSIDTMPTKKIRYKLEEMGLRKLPKV